MVLVDYYSRFYEVDVLRSTTSEVVIERLAAHFARHGLPDNLRSDNGPQFVSASFVAFLEEHGVQHRRTTPYWPRANGEVERQNRSILKALRIANSQGLPLHRELTRYLSVYRTTPHPATGRTPASLVFNRPIRSKYPSMEMHTEDLAVREANAKVKVAMVPAQRRQPPLRQPPGPGDEVLVKKTNVSNKLHTPYDTEPHKVVSRTGDQMVLEAPDGHQFRRNVQFTKCLERPTPPSQELTPTPEPARSLDADNPEDIVTETQDIGPMTQHGYSLRLRAGLQGPARFQ